MLETIERMAHVATVKLSAQPNAGRPREIEGRNIYLCSPEYMASYARRFISNGVRLVGGCCGTTPDHVRNIKAAVRALNGAAATATGPRRSGVRAHGAGGRRWSIRCRARKSRGWRTAWRAARSSSASSCCRRAGFRAEALVEQARQLRIHGVDLVNIPDGPRASARMSALSAAVLVQQQAGIETILHYACRDRNLLGMQSDLLGAHSMGVRNVLLITGDPPQVGDYPDATGVFDVDSIGLTNMVTRLNRGLDIGGQSIGAPTAFHIGVAVNPGALDPDEELRRFAYKVEAGAEFAITQPCSTPRSWRGSSSAIEASGFRCSRRSCRSRAFATPNSWPTKLPGVRVPDEVVDRMRARRGRRPGRGGRAGDRARDCRGDPSARAGHSDFDRRQSDRERARRHGSGVGGAPSARYPPGRLQSLAPAISTRI